MNRGYSTADMSSCGNNSFSPQLEIEFSQPAVSVVLRVSNNLPEPATYVITDNLGRTRKIRLQACCGFFTSARDIGIFGTGITRVRVTPESQSSIPNKRWDFAIAFIVWRPDLPACECAGTSGPSPHRVTGHNWAMDVEVSANDGIVLRNVTLGHRLMAKEISLPYYLLQTSAFQLTRAELKPNSTDQIARSRLIDYREELEEEKLVIYAVYIVSDIPQGSGSCLRITQRYEFHKAIEGGCEPSENLQCARFKPIVEYKFDGANNEMLTSINTVQRAYFLVDGLFDKSTAGIFRDCDNPFNLFGPCFNEIFLQKRNPLREEHIIGVIETGNDRGTWDNFHQTNNSFVAEPTFAGLSGITDEAGCPECVHIHWRWGKIASDPNLGGGPAFGDGKPLIPEGSTQSVDFAVVRHHPGEEDPNNYTTLALDNPEPLISQGGERTNIVFWYSATGSLPQDAFFTHGGFFNPATPDVTITDDDVTITFANFFEDGTTTVTPIDPELAGQLPPGFAAFNDIAYEIKTDAVVSGPFRVVFDLPADTDPAVLENLRVFHKETDPDDPTRTLLVDRTLLPPDDDGFGLREEINIKTIGVSANSVSSSVTAIVDSLGQFVIARLNAPNDQTLIAVKDSFLRQGADDKNEGANERLRIQSSGNNRALIGFDLSAIETEGLESAMLVLTIAENSDNWGNQGRVVEAHRLLEHWTEGNGRNDLMVGGGPGTRGSGEGVTWRCASDADISNHRADCEIKWNGGNFAPATGGGSLHQNGQTGEVMWDVTADVMAGAGFGWLIKKREEGQAGQVRYYSREGAQAAGDMNLAPKLILVYRR